LEAPDVAQTTIPSWVSNLMQNIEELQQYIVQQCINQIWNRDLHLSKI